MKFSALKMATIPLVAGALTMSGHGQLNEPTAVEGAGCVWKGVEARCLVVRDNETDRLYNLLIFSGSRPEVGTGIFFMGSIHHGPTACMQGTPVEVKSWVKRKMNCTEQKKKNPNPY